jgi:transcriptional regulator with XRE-family HTH domain
MRKPCVNRKDCLTCNLFQGNPTAMNALDTYMTANKMTATALALRLQVSVPTVSKWRRGLIRPDYEMAAKIEDETGGEVPVASWVRRESA